MSDFNKDKKMEHPDQDEILDLDDVLFPGREASAHRQDDKKEETDLREPVSEEENDTSSEGSAPDGETDSISETAYDDGEAEVSSGEPDSDGETVNALEHPDDGEEQETVDKDEISETMPEDTSETGEPKQEEVKKEPSILDELEFISHESVRDKSKMAEGEEIDDELVSKKKTKRRSVDAEEALKEKSLKIARKNLPVIIIVIAVIIVLLVLLSRGLKTWKANKAAENMEQPVSAQEYEKDQHEEINTLLKNYYEAYADGDTETILQYAYPMSDSEKSYIQMYSEYVDEYRNITCYTKTLAGEDTYIVSVSFDVKYKGVDTAAPGMDFFYVRSSGEGSVYIDNTYSPFNLLYQEYTLDQSILQVIQDYEAGEDVIALQAGVQTKYEQVLEQDENLRVMIEETLANAVAAWTAEHESAMQQKEQEAAQQVQEETAAEEQAAAEQAAAEQAAAETAETENKAWVYVNDTVNIRQEPNETSAVLASATKGSQIRQLAVTNNGWCKVKTGEIVGYIKAEYISAEQTTSSSGTISEGKTIELTSSVNIRSSMSESSERVGLAYAGETVTVIMSYSEGWTKVNWNGQTGYIRTDVLEGM